MSDILYHVDSSTAGVGGTGVSYVASSGRRNGFWQEDITTNSNAGIISCADLVILEQSELKQ